VKSGAVFHVRIRIASEQRVPLAVEALGAELLAAVRRYHEAGRWWCRLVVLMPDHLHAMLSFPEHGAGMAATVRDWKRGTARFQSVKSQTNFFDHRLRSESEADEAWVCFGNNPVAKGLAVRAEDWPWRWSPFEANRGAQAIGGAR
jgi:REP element-mobilizing transposase RayT